MCTITTFFNIGDPLPLQFQRYHMKEFCALNQISPALPSRIKDLDTLFKHLLYDDSRKIVLCYVPKNGCSNLKRMMLILNGILPANASLDPHSRPSEDLLGSVSCVAFSN